MLPLPAARTYEEGLPSKAGISRFGDSAVPINYGIERIQFVSPHPSMGQRNLYQSLGASPAPSTLQTGHIGQGQSTGRGRAQGFQAESSDQAGQMTCFHCHQPKHMRRVCPRKQRSHGTAG